MTDKLATTAEQFVVVVVIEDGGWGWYRVVQVTRLFRVDHVTFLPALRSW